MRSSSTPESAGPEEFPTVTSILGVANLRFRPHRLTTKPHVVLRRVEFNQTDSDDGKTSSVVYFSLFAAKRIEVKAGKEILLTVEDGLYKDKPIILEGDEEEAVEDLDQEEDEDDTQVAEEEEEEPPPPPPPPPEMIIPPKMRRAWVKPKIEESEVSSILFDPPPIQATSVLEVLHPVKLEKAMQTDPLPSSIVIPSHPSHLLPLIAQPEFRPLAPPYICSKCNNPSAKLALSVQIPKTPHLNGGTKSSPMELDSAPLRPASVGHVLAAPASPALSAVSSMDVSPIEMTSVINLISPIHTPVASPTETKPIITPPPTIPSQPATAPKAQMEPISDMFDLPQVPQTPASLRQPNKRKPAPRNPFVSGGIVTNFVGLSTELSKPDIVRVKEEDTSDSIDSLWSSPPGLNNLAFTQAPQPTLVASSSKLSLESLNPPAPPPAKRQPHRSARARAQSPVTLEKALAQAEAQTWAPPPKLRDIATVSSGPLTNPLSIRPSSMNVIPVREVVVKPEPIEPTLFASAPVSVRKKLVVGNGWPLVKNSGSASASTATNSWETRKAPPKFVKSQSKQVSPPDEPSLPTPATRPDPPASSKWRKIGDQERAPEPFTSIPPPISAPVKRASVHTEAKSIPSQPRALDRVSNVTVKTEPVQPTLSFADVYEAASAPPRTSPMSRLPPTSLSHPLPPKPQEPRGVKRERQPSPDLYSNGDNRRRPPKWPIMQSIHSSSLSGSGDLRVRHVAISPDGNLIAVVCRDKTVRIWDNYTRKETARLSHNAPIVCAHWMKDDGLIQLGEDRIVSTWLRTSLNQWRWSKVVDVGGERNISTEECICMAYAADRFAVSSPRTGVKVWMKMNGVWQQQRSIVRQNVTALRFVNQGCALLGGTKDGVLWYCDVPNGTLRAYAFLKARITSIDVERTGTRALVGLVDTAKLVNIHASNQGVVEKVYVRNEQNRGDFGALLVASGERILFSSEDGYGLIWDVKKARLVGGLDHHSDDILAAACFDSVRDGYLLTGTTHGQLRWWSQPHGSSGRDLKTADTDHKRAKRMK